LRGVELDCLVELPAGKTPEEHPAKSSRERSPLLVASADTAMGGAVRTV
jgi:hypothetical protein